MHSHLTLNENSNQISKQCFISWKDKTLGSCRVLVRRASEKWWNRSQHNITGILYLWLCPLCFIAHSWIIPMYLCVVLYACTQRLKACLFFKTGSLFTGQRARSSGLHLQCGCPEYLCLCQLLHNIYAFNRYFMLLLQYCTQQWSSSKYVF